MPEELPIHPLLLLLEQPSEEEAAAFTADLRSNGMIHPIMLGEWQDETTGEMIEGIVSGAVRYRLAREAGVELRYERVPQGTDAKAYILSSDVMRRHMAKGQIAMLIATVYPEGPGQGSTGRGRGGSSDPAVRFQEIWNLTNETVRKARELIRVCQNFPENHPMRHYPEMVLRGDPDPLPPPPYNRRKLSLDCALALVRDPEGTQRRIQTRGEVSARVGPLLRAGSGATPGTPPRGVALDPLEDESSSEEEIDDWYDEREPGPEVQDETWTTPEQVTRVVTAFMGVLNSALPETSERLITMLRDQRQAYSAQPLHKRVSWIRGMMIAMGVTKEDL